MRKKATTTQEPVAAPAEEKEIRKTRKPRAPRKKKVEETSEQTEPQTEPKTEPIPETKLEPKPQPEAQPQIEPQPMAIPSLPNIEIKDIIDLLQAPLRAIVLTDQQIQQLTLEEIEQRHVFLQKTLVNVLDYDVVISDTNIWLELLLGHTPSHSDPRVNARLQFERQLEFISKIMKYRGGRFMIMGETYEEIDRFASMQDPQDHKDADWTDNLVCLNAAARLAKRLILTEQRENRLRIEGISAESHHSAFADPAIVRRVVELFAEGKKVLLITNDASVAIRSMGLCDDLQRYNNVSDKDWNEMYVPLRPMVFTFEDLKVLDFYTRQYHYIQMASGQPWMQTIGRSQTPRISSADGTTSHEPLIIDLNAFRPGDKHRGDNLFSDQEKQVLKQKEQHKQQQQKQQKQQQQKQQQKQELQKQELQKQPEPKKQPESQKQQEPQKQQQEAKPEPVVAETKPEEQKPAKKPRRRPGFNEKKEK